MNTAGEKNQINIGEHIFWFEEPDLTYTIFVGDVSGSEMASIGQNIKDALNGRKYFGILDLTRLGSFSSEAKKAFRTIPTPISSAVIGASTQLRVVATILAKGFAMMHRGADSPTEFFADEASARAWVQKLREKTG
jgi:hypothetical protein